MVSQMDRSLGFEPFDKPLDELVAEDILRLKHRGVAEGLFVEYKEEPPKASAIAKSIASFANAHGGWLMIGVKSGAQNEPVAFPGIPLNDCSPDHIRNCVVGQLSPVPRFTTQVVKHGEDENRRFIVVKVPEGDDPPYVRNDGRIYRRHGEGGDPVPEADRHALDRLFQKREERKRKLELFFEPWRTSPPLPCHEIYIRPEPLLDLWDRLYDDPYVLMDEMSHAVPLEGSGADEEPMLRTGIPLDLVQGGVASVIFEQRVSQLNAHGGISDRAWI